MLTLYALGGVVTPNGNTHTLPSTVPPVGAPAQLSDGGALAAAGAGSTTPDSVPSAVAATPAMTAARLVSLIATLLRSSYGNTRVSYEDTRLAHRGLGLAHRGLGA